MKLVLFIYRRLLIRKLRKLQKKETRWNGDILYNQAIEDAIKVVYYDGDNNP